MSSAILTTEELLGEVNEVETLTTEELFGKTERPTAKILTTEELFAESKTEISATPEGFKMRPKTPEESQADFDFAIQNMADKIFTHASGLTPQEGIKGQEKLSNIMVRAPLAGMAFASPLIALGYESFNQAKNLIVSGVKGEKYAPQDVSMLSELIPSDVNNVVKIGSSVAENLADIALMGGLVNLAKQGLLTDTIKTIGKKLEIAGYGTGKVTINRDALREAAKGTTLEEEATLWLKAQ